MLLISIYMMYIISRCPYNNLCHGTCVCVGQSKVWFKFFMCCGAVHLVD